MYTANIATIPCILDLSEGWGIWEVLVLRSSLIVDFVPVNRWYIINIEDPVEKRTEQNVDIVKISKSTAFRQTSKLNVFVNDLSR